MKPGDSTTKGRRRRSASAQPSAAAPAGTYLSLATGGNGATTPAATIGLDIDEPLHRFDANVHLPTRERGVSSANRIGEPLATMTMRLRFVPEGFDAAGVGTGAIPETAIRPGVSQRVVLRDGRIRFDDRQQTTLLFSGAGRTFPATTDGRPLLLVTGVAVVTGGTGALEGARGTLTISGEVTNFSAVSLTVAGHLDPAGAMTVEDALSPLMDMTVADLPATVLTLVGDTDALGVERLRVARLGTDLPRADRLRSLIRVGARVGTVAGRWPGAAPDQHAAMPLTGASRTLTFTDPAGVVIGTIAAATLDGTTIRDVCDGHPVGRVVAYGAATDGTGALAGAGGLLTVASTTGANGATLSLYTLRLVDPRGRFRPAYTDVYKPMPLAAVDSPSGPAPWSSLHFADGVLATMPAGDAALLRHVESALADGAELMQWSEERDRTNRYAETFALERDPNDGDRSFGFFDVAAVANAALPVMGTVQEMFYDRLSASALREGSARDQLKEFVLKYFLRLAGERRGSEPPVGERARRSSGYRQLYFKRRDSGTIGRFRGDEQPAIVDLREIGTIYDWVLLRVDAFDFNISFAPFGSGAPTVQLPLRESSYLVIGPPFIRNQDTPAPGVAARCGLGVAFVPYAPENPGMIAYGPGHLAAAIQNIDFTLLDDGEIRARAAFIVNRPKQMARVDFDPIEWTLKLADVLTFGAASRVMSPVKSIAETLPLRVSGLDPIATSIWIVNAILRGTADGELAHSKALFEQRMLAQHAQQHREMLTRSLRVWRMVPDWMDEDRLPAFCREGAA